MEIRGERECRDCGTRWRYYDTGSVVCPSCGSLVSVGVDERTRHTDSPVDLDLSAVRLTAEESGVVAAVAGVDDALREYLSRRGFVDAGDLLPLDDTYLAAAELRNVADVVDRRGTVDRGEELYLLSLFTGVDGGERPGLDVVPGSLTAPRNAAYAAAILDYRSEVVTHIRGEDVDPARRTLGRVVERAKRVRALGGDVDATETETLVAATRAVRDALRGDEAALARADERLDTLD